MSVKIQEFINNISDPVTQRVLQLIFETLDTEVDALRTLANELKTDHATQKTSYDAVETLIEELHDDHATFRTAVLQQKTAMKNISLSDGAIAIATTVQKVKSTATINYIIDGVFYTKAATDNLWVLTGFDCADTKVNKCLLCLDTSGAMQIAAGTEGATAGAVVLPTIPASYAVVGMVQVTQSGGAFTGGTTGLDDATTTDVYTDLAFHPDTVGDAPGTLGSSKPASGPGSLTAPVVSESLTL